RTDGGGGPKARRGGPLSVIVPPWAGGGRSWGSDLRSPGSGDQMSGLPGESEGGGSGGEGGGGGWAGGGAGGRGAGAAGGGQGRRSASGGAWGAARLATRRIRAGWGRADARRAAYSRESRSSAPASGVNRLSRSRNGSDMTPPVPAAGLRRRRRSAGRRC